MKIATLSSLIVLCLTSPLRSPAAEALVNGDLEQFVDGLPVGWDVLDLGALAVSTTQTSPFPGNGLSTHSIYFPANAPGFGELSQNFAPFTAPYRFSFDFMLEGAATGVPWLITVGGTSNPDFYLGIGEGMFRVSDGESFGSTPHAVTALAPQTWYHVTVLVDPAAFHFSGSITPFGGAPADWDGLEMHRYDGDTRNLVIHGPAEITTPLYLDNFSIVPVPEPSTVLFLVAGLAAAWRASRRRRIG